eukprot:10823640-Alexandrium_andersonii.AAC.1
MRRILAGPWAVPSPRAAGRPARSAGIRGLGRWGGALACPPRRSWPTGTQRRRRGRRTRRRARS